MAKSEKKKTPAKKFSAKRTLNPPGMGNKKRKGRVENSGAPFSEQDPKRRLGDYGGAGEHPRTDMGHR